MSSGKKEPTTQSEIGKPPKRRGGSLRLRVRIADERQTRKQDLGDLRLQFLLDASHSPATSGVG